MSKLNNGKNELLGTVGLAAVLVACSLINATHLGAQPQEAIQPEFEVASVKPVDNSKLGNSISMNIGTVRHEEVTIGNATLQDCIRFAYGVRSDAQIAGPDWIKSKQFLYDIVAKGAPGTSREHLEAMMRALLANRFKLAIHREPKKMSYYALVVARFGPKIQPMKDAPDNFHGITWPGRIDSILTMPMRAYLLSRFDTERPIIDSTDLSGKYEVKLHWTDSRKIQDADDAAEPPLFTAIEEQLGVKLEPRKGPLEILVVDGAEKVPTEN
jgi:uncharacterized protein (TIGR03435 family)